MSSSRETVEFIREQMDPAGVVSTRAMFGEYALYLDGKAIALICDDTLYLKDTPGARALLDAPDTGHPYPGSKPYLIGDTLLDEPDTLIAVALAIWADLPVPKPKKPRKPKA